MGGNAVGYGKWKWKRRGRDVKIRNERGYSMNNPGQVEEKANVAELTADVGAKRNRGAVAGEFESEKSVSFRCEIKEARIGCRNMAIMN
jgi:hypothetical protein